MCGCVEGCGPAGLETCERRPIGRARGSHLPACRRPSPAQPASHAPGAGAPVIYSVPGRGDFVVGITSGDSCKPERSSAQGLYLDLSTKVGWLVGGWAGGRVGGRAGGLIGRQHRPVRSGGAARPCNEPRVRATPAHARAAERCRCLRPPPAPQCILNKVVGWLLSREGPAHADEAQATTNGVDANIKRFTQRAFCYL